MKRMLLLLPLLVVPPGLVAGFFLWREAQQTKDTPTLAVADNLQAARTAYDQAGRHLSKARQTGSGKNSDLQQAIVQYRVCLAYEAGTAHAGQLFADAHQQLEVSKLLLEQSNRHTPGRLPAAAVVKTAPPAPPPAPVLSARSKSETVPTKVVAASPAPPPVTAAEQKPVPVVSAPSIKVAAVKPPPVKVITVGPDGVIFETVDSSEAEKDDKK